MSLESFSSSEKSQISYFNTFLLNYINLKATFPPLLDTNYEIEQHYYAKNFKSNFEMVKKIIYDMATEQDYQVQFEIIVKKKKKLNQETSFTPCRTPFVLNYNAVKKTAHKEPEIKKMHRHKNCPKLFGKTFFNLVLNNVSFQKKFVSKEELNIKSEDIKYPSIEWEDLNINDFYDWVKKNNYHTKYTNLKTFREIWEYKSTSCKGYDEKWKENHYKFFLSRLMKIFFEEYAYNYIINSNIMSENGEQYLNLIPKFLRGIEDPTSFLCLLE